MIAKNAFQHGVLLDQLSKNNILNAQETGNPSVRIINGAVFWLKYSGSCRERDGNMLFTFSTQEDDAARIQQWLEQYDEVYMALVCHTALYREVALLDRKQLKEWADFLEMEKESLNVFINKKKKLRVGSLYGEVAFTVDQDRLSQLHLPLPQSLREPRQASKKPQSKEPVTVQFPTTLILDENGLPDLDKAFGVEMDDALKIRNLEEEIKLLRRELHHKSRKLASINNLISMLLGGISR
jgi:hypothetical protein